MEKHIILETFEVLHRKGEIPALRKLCGLYHSAFARNEQRDWKDIIAHGKPRKAAYTPTAVYAGDDLVGLCTYWTLTPGWCYLEHLAFFTRYRGCGLGSQLLKQLRKGCELVLEVEPPSLSSMAEKRLRFYLRNGFEILSKNYWQPPYRLEDQPTALWLLSTTKVGTQKLETEIHQCVYNATEID